MKTILLLITLGAIVACNSSTPVTPQARFDDAIKKLAAASTEEERFYALTTASKEAFVLGRYDDARRYAEELKELTPRFTNNWNYGNAVQDFNLVLGRLALRDDNLEQAKHHLLASGQSSGSPQMNSFGPNMSLAKELLEKNEKHVVLEYFALTRSFWKMDNGRLDQWSKEVEAGKIPDFGANLVY